MGSAIIFVAYTVRNSDPVVAGTIGVRNKHRISFAFEHVRSRSRKLSNFRRNGTIAL
jgi:hypothetical protein